MHFKQKNKILKAKIGNQQTQAGRNLVGLLNAIQNMSLLPFTNVTNIASRHVAAKGR
jgi:hypothetical protein